MRLTLGAIALVLSVALVCLWPRTAPDAEGTPGVVRADMREIIELEQRVLALEANLRALSLRCQRDAERHEAEPAPASVTPPPAAAAAEAPSAPASSPAQRLERALEREPIDHSRQDVVRRTLTAQLAAHGSQTRVDSVECSASVCRCVLQHESRWAQTSLDASLEGWEALAAGANVVYDIDQSLEPPVTVAYVVTR